MAGGVRPPGVAKPGQKNSLFARGDSVFATADRANAEAKLKSQISPSQNRFYLKQGGAAEIIILDDKITIGLYEHEVPIPNSKRKRYVPCIAAVPNLSCPLCRAGDRRLYRMFVTILDLSEYETRDGKKVTRTKRLLPINQGEKERWQSIQQDAIKLYGSLRGTYIYMKRPNEQRSSRIGEPFAIESKLFQHISEAELAKHYGHKPVVEGGKIIKPANDDLKVYDYDAIFPYPDDEFVNKLEQEFGNGVPQSSSDDNSDVGETARPGSASDIDAAWGEEIEDGNPEDQIPMEHGEEEIAEGGVDVTGLGETADGGDQDAAQTLTEVATELGIDVNEYGTWSEVEVAIGEARGGEDEGIEHMVEPEPEPEPAPKPKPMLRKPTTPAAPAKPTPGLKRPGTPTAPAKPAAPVARPGLAKPGVAKPGLARPGVKPPAAPAKPTPGLKRPALPSKPAPVAKPSAPKPGGISRPNRGAFND